MKLFLNFAVSCSRNLTDKIFQAIKSNTSLLMAWSNMTNVDEDKFLFVQKSRRQDKVWRFICMNGCAGWGLKTPPPPNPPYTKREGGGSWPLFNLWRTVLSVGCDLDGDGLIQFEETDKHWRCEIKYWVSLGHSTKKPIATHSHVTVGLVGCNRLQGQEIWSLMVQKVYYHYRIKRVLYYEKADLHI